MVGSRRRRGYRQAAESRGWASGQKYRCQAAVRVLDGDHQRFLAQGEVRHFLKYASSFNKDMSRAVDHDFAYGVVADQVLDGPQEWEDGFETEH